MASKLARVLRRGMITRDASAFCRRSTVAHSHTDAQNAARPDVLFRSAAPEPSFSIFSHTPAATEAIGMALGRLHTRGLVVCVRGNLGAGKTVLARGFVRGAVGDPAAEVTSPTFLLDNTYVTSKGLTLHHMDLYRLRGPEDTRVLGLPSIFSRDVSIIEWPQRMGDAAPREGVRVCVCVRGDAEFPTPTLELESPVMRTLGVAVAEVQQLLRKSDAESSAAAPSASSDVEEDTLTRAVTFTAVGRSFTALLQQLRQDATLSALPMTPLA